MKLHFVYFTFLLFTFFKNFAQSNPWQQIYVPPTFPAVSALASIGNTLYAATDLGVVSSTNLGLTWNNIMPTFGVATILSKGDTLYAGGNSMSGPTVAVSYNAGNSWSNITPLIFTWFGNSIFSMLVNGSHLYIGATQGYGIYRCPLANLQSNAWTTYTTGFSSPPQVACLGFNGTNLVATLFGGTVWSSPTGTALWTPSSTGISNISNLRTLSISGSTAYIGGLGPNNVMRSLNGGSSWTPVNAPFTPTGEVRAITMNNDHVYAGTNLDGVIFSNNGGLNWASFNSGFKSTSGSWICNGFMVNALLLKNDTIYAGTSCGVWRASGCSYPIIASNTSSMEVCSGMVSTMHAAGAGTLTWYSSQTSTVPIATGSILVTGPLGSGTTYYVKNNFCNTRSPMSVTVHPLPTLSVVASRTAFCPGEQVTLVGSGALSYTWNLNTTGPQITLTPSASTVYSVTGSGTYGCINSKTVALSILPLPQLSLTISQTSICVGETVTISAQGALNYTWNTGSTENHIVANPKADTTFFVTGSDSNSCLSNESIQVKVFLCNSVDEARDESIFRCSPNPSNGGFKFSELRKGSVIEITDATGRRVFIVEASARDEIVDLKHKTKGVYFYHIVYSGKTIGRGKLILSE